jgi:hypothetical protein
MIIYLTELLMHPNNIFLRVRRAIIKVTFSSLFLFILSFLFLITSCEEPSFIGLEIQPDSDRFVVREYEDRHIESSVHKRDSLLAIGHLYSFLGVINDPVFGKSEASFMTQLWVSVLGRNFGDDPQADSLMLYLRIADVYGDSLAPQEIIVYELGDSLVLADNYYTNFDPWQIVDRSNVLASFTYHPAPGDTIIAIPLDNQDFIEKLFSAPDTARADRGQFVEYIYGIYVSASPLDERGSIYYVDLQHSNSILSLYYNHAENRDTLLRYNYGLANRVNLYDHDYSEAVFYEEIGQTGKDEPFYYVQGISGVMGRLDFADFDMWRDSMDISPISINSARLTLPVAAGTTDGFPPPGRLTLLDKNSEGNFVTILDGAIGDDHFGGEYNEETGEYSFNVTNFLRSYIKRKSENSSLYVAVRNSAIVPNRVVLRDKDHPSGGPKLDITYTKH